MPSKGFAGPPLPPFLRAGLHGPAYLSSPVSVCSTSALSPKGGIWLERRRKERGVGTHFFPPEWIAVCEPKRARHLT